MVDRAMEIVKHLLPHRGWYKLATMIEVVAVVSLSILVPIFVAITFPIWILPVLFCWRDYRKQCRHRRGVVSLERAMHIRRDLEGAGRTVVFTNGHFDLLHVGHLSYLQGARDLGDTLIVGLNDDASTRELKGDGRPIIPQAGRALMLAALSCVDYVVIFEGLTANRLVEALEPDIYVKGGDWGNNRMPPEAAVVANYGGEVRFLPYLSERSTTGLIETIMAGVGGRGTEQIE